MRVDRIDIHHVAMPLIQPWVTAHGHEDAIECILLRIERGGAHGWGESSMLGSPGYSAEFAAGAFELIKRWFAPALIGQEIDSGEALQQGLAHFRDNPFAKAALDMAWWALQSEMTGEPLHRLLGGDRDVVEVGADFGVAPTLDDLLANVGGAVE